LEKRQTLKPMTEPEESGAAHEPSPPEAMPAAPVEEDDAVGVQYEGVGTGPILGFVFVAVLLIATVVWVGMNGAEGVAQQAREAAAVDLNYPELRQSQLRAAQRLNQYKVIDAGRGVYQIPIDRAIDLMVREAYQTPGGSYSPELQLAPAN
jgi:hypothetical protein